MDRYLKKIGENHEAIRSFSRIIGRFGAMAQARQVIADAVGSQRMIDAMARTNAVMNNMLRTNAAIAAMTRTNAVIKEMSRTTAAINAIARHQAIFDSIASSRAAFDVLDLAKIPSAFNGPSVVFDALNSVDIEDEDRDTELMLERFVSLKPNTQSTPTESGTLRTRANDLAHVVWLIVVPENWRHDLVDDFYEDRDKSLGYLTLVTPWMSYRSKFTVATSLTILKVSARICYMTAARIPSSLVDLFRPKTK